MSRFVFAFDPHIWTLRSPISVAGVTSTTREVALVSAAGANGTDIPRAIGEAAPLPGLHTETLDDLEAAFDDEAQEALFAESFEDCAAALTHVPPTLRFAIESIRLGWQAQIQQTSVAAVLSDTPRDTLDVTALIQAAPDAVVPAGATSLKIKVGRREPQVEHAALTTILAALPATTSVCLDANRAWTLDEAIAWLAPIDVSRFEYIEEPLRTPEDLPALFAQTGLLVALDESLHESQHDALADTDAVAAYVVKPSRCGIAQTLAWDRRAQAAGKRTVISSCFESPVGIGMLAQIAAALPSHTGAAGIGTLAWFEPVPTLDGFDPATHSIRLRHTT